jgi:hypothetical protein
VVVVEVLKHHILETGYLEMVFLVKEIMVDMVLTFMVVEVEVQVL